nr:polysaccharide deacetylase family protein [Roseomonas acroporae]
MTLSFDNGPEPTVTPQVLDSLRARGLRSTFFTIGRKLAVPAGAALARQAYEEGHWIGNHTWSHGTPLGELAETGHSSGEILDTQAAIGELAHPLRLFRPFGGGGHLDRRLLNAEAVRTLRAGGFTCVLWNAVPRDWADPEGWCETALRQIAERPWTLLVLHDLPTGAMAHLDRFLDAAAAAGARFRQDFPPDCVPIRGGEVVGDLSGMVMG